AGEGDGGGRDAPDASQASGWVDDQRPRRSLRVRRDENGMRISRHHPLGDESFDARAAGQVEPGLEEAHVEGRSRFELEPRKLAVRQEDRWQPEASRALVDDLRAAARVRIETLAEERHLRVVRMAGDVAAVAGGDERAGRVASGVVLRLTTL